MKLIDGIVLGLCVLLSACATGPTFPPLAEQAAYYTDGAKDALAKGNNASAVVQIDVALERPSGPTKIKELFAAQPKARELYLTSLEDAVANVSNISQASEAMSRLKVAKSSDLFPADRMNLLLATVVNKVLNGNLSGAMSINWGDRLYDFPELETPPHQRAIANRAIASLQMSGGSRPISYLMDYVSQVGLNSEEALRIESLLPTMHIRVSELGMVAKTFPKFAAARKEETTVFVFLQFKNGDRILADDVSEVLRSRVRGVNWVSSSGEKVTTVTIERVRSEEKILPERKQTITYARHEVNLFSAALLMPSNASYLYEIVSGGAEIEYGYVVSAVSDGKVVYDELIRGKVSGEYRRCENARIQNVFGGVTSAGFVANPDMEQQCAGPQTSSVDELRKGVLTKIADGVLNVPSIKRAHDLY